MQIKNQKIIKAQNCMCAVRAAHYKNICKMTERSMCNDLNERLFSCKYRVSACPEALCTRTTSPPYVIVKHYGVTL